MKRKLNILIHCKFSLIRKGIESQIRKLSYDADITYADLLESGIVNQCNQKKYDFIMVLPTKPDEDFLLCLKLKYFVSDIPVIFISSHIPDNYRQQLERWGIEIIMELPLNAENVDKIDKLFSEKIRTKSIYKP